jgi:hypothetical protein
MKQPSSETSISLRGASSAIGMPLGGRGLETSGNSNRAAAWLAGHRPAEVDKAALSRASSLNAGLAIKMVDGLPVKVQVFGTPQDRADAASAIEGFFTPAPKPQIEEWLAELSVITRRKQDDDITEGLRLNAYSSRLAEYPADIAKEALLRHKWLFFPAWAELQDVCDKLAAPRRAMLWHLQNAPVEEQENREIPSAERRAEMVAYAQRVVTEMAERATDGN